MWATIDEEGYLVEAHRLAEPGWIERRVDGGELWRRVTDEAYTAVKLAGATLAAGAMN